MSDHLLELLAPARDADNAEVGIAHLTAYRHMSFDQIDEYKEVANGVAV